MQQQLAVVKVTGALEKSTKSQSGRRINFPLPVRELLKQWLFDHQEDPFPTESEKVKLCKKTNLSMLQLNNWFINARRRYLKQ
jgi:hypothetical protein